MSSMSNASSPPRVRRGARQQAPAAPADALAELNDVCAHRSTHFIRFQPDQEHASDAVDGDAPLAENIERELFGGDDEPDEEEDGEELFGDNMER
jgi:hypothetical protein